MYDEIDSINHLFGDAVHVHAGRVTVGQQDALASPAMDALAREAVFGDGQSREYARWLVWEIGQAVGVRVASIHDFYRARGRGEIGGFTCPAINVRGMAYDTARAIFRTARRLDAGAFLLEIARSEIAYTSQRPAEYVAVILAAALREGHRGPVFIQGDHFQVNLKKYALDPAMEVAAVQQLIFEAVAAGFYNIDIDTSTLVDLTKKAVSEQQRKNYEVGVALTLYTRSLEPPGVTISVGGEIGEVGTENSTVEELHAYMTGFASTLMRESPGTDGLSKISVQSGTTHGGVVLADGSIAEVDLDLDTLARLSKVAREEYGLAGAVQHGASTLPDSAFHRFPRADTAEIHLATNFQTMLYDNLPAALRDEIYQWLRLHATDERKPTDSDDQFFYRTRKKALGPFKRQLWDLDDATKARLSEAYDKKFTFLFTQLGITGTARHVARFVTPLVQHRPVPAGATPAVASAPDDADLSD
ncbi:MAG: class II fructose-bisphosphate aldolase [Gemmatimonadaceae bacterium]